MRSTLLKAHDFGMTNTTQTKVSANVEAVQRLYGAYGRGDVDGVLAELADDVDWAAEASRREVPWWGPFNGKNEVPRFFQAIGENIEVTEFDLVSFASNDSDVVATVHWTFTVKATGKTASMYMQHWFRLANGKIVFFRGSEDTAQSLAAFS
jgi:ketosteroid isomerase-like protein